jgi:ParB family chromosome partitioning protein
MNHRDKLPPSRRGALGKGISSLLGDVEVSNRAPPPVDAPESEPARSHALVAEVVRLPIDDVQPNPHQPRKIFDDTALKELSASLKEDGILQPIVVSKGDSDAKYTIIAGERRWRASKLAGFETIPAIVKEGVGDDMLRLALIENIQRADLNVIEEAEAYASLIKDYGLTQEQCADKVGKERSTVANALRLLSLPRELQDDIMDGRVTMGHGRAILSLEEKKLMLRARDIVIKKGLSVRQTEQLCKTFKQTQKLEESGGATPKEDADLNYITESLRSYLHTKVRLSGNASRGRIEIAYFSAAELERILKRMGYSY